jgi:Flp pilus assembly protein TadB|tara:strand:- start:389 stop:700 length:312 start_codon:yes stop_codon:yes gene_type:complete
MADNNTTLIDHVQREEQRLARIEDKIDKLSDAMIDLARAEEKLINIEKANSQHFERMNRFSMRMDDMEDSLQEQGKTVKVMQYIITLSATVFAGVVVKIFFDA